jgi:hypothetical protein
MKPLAQLYAEEHARLAELLRELEPRAQVHLTKLQSPQNRYQFAYSQRITVACRRLEKQAETAQALAAFYANYDAAHPNDPPYTGPSLWDAIEAEWIARKFEDLRFGPGAAKLEV